MVKKTPVSVYRLLSSPSNKNFNKLGLSCAKLRLATDCCEQVMKIFEQFMNKTWISNEKRRRDEHVMKK